MSSGLPTPPDLGNEAERRRLGPSSLRLFCRIMEAWKVSDDEARPLLTLAPGKNPDDLDPAMLSEEQLLRISCLTGIYKALRIYLQNELAGRWIRLANSNAMFGGRSPLEYMAAGGLQELRNVRNLLDAWCQGN